MVLPYRQWTSTVIHMLWFVPELVCHCHVSVTRSFTCCTTTSSTITACPACESLPWDQLGLEITSMYRFFYCFASKYPVSDASSFPLPTTKNARFTMCFVVFIMKYNEIDYHSSRIYRGIISHRRGAGNPSLYVDFQIL